MLEQDGLSEFAARLDSNGWRWARYYLQEVDELFAEHMATLQQVYGAYCTGIAGRVTFMNPEDFEKLCYVLHLTESPKVCHWAFRTSMMTQVDEFNSQRHLQMSFIEFLEAFSRVIEISGLGEECFEKDWKLEHNSTLRGKLEAYLPQLNNLLSYS